MERDLLEEVVRELDDELDLKHVLLAAPHVTISITRTALELVVLEEVEVVLHAGHRRVIGVGAILEGGVERVANEPRDLRSHAALSRQGHDRKLGAHQLLRISQALKEGDIKIEAVSAFSSEGKDLNLGSELEVIADHDELLRALGEGS